MSENIKASEPGFLAQERREELIHTICPFIREYSCGEGVDTACSQCPATVTTAGYGDGVQACRHAAERAANAVLAFFSPGPVWQGGDGHGKPCYYCGNPCNNLAGNPGEWAIPLCHADEPGVVKWHHEGCVAARLSPPDDANSFVEPGRTKREGIYVTSKLRHAHVWRTLRDHFKEPILSSWIDEAGAGETTDVDDLWHRCISEAATAKALIAYCESDDALKGGWIEIGVALRSGIPVFAVGIEAFTIGKYRGVRHFPDLRSAFAAFHELPEVPAPLPPARPASTRQWEKAWDDLLTAARNMPRATPGCGGASTEHPFTMAAWQVWDLDRAIKVIEKLKESND